MSQTTDAAAVRIFPPVIPLITILLGVGLDKLFPLDLGITIPAPARYWLGGAIVLAALLGLGAWSVLLLRQDGQSENPWKPTLRIIDKGPFRFTRNPMYLQMVIVCAGVAIALTNGWVLLLTPVCGWLLHVLAILPEEAYLTAKFGDDYRAYQQRTRRWL